MHRNIAKRLGEVMGGNVANVSIAYCESCRENRPVRLVDQVEKLTVGGITYSYNVQYGYCTLCGEKATPQDVLEKNQHAFSAAVREKNHIVSQDVVNDVLQRYDIKARPLSKLLGWGEHTYSRFVEGDIPSRPLSQRIASLWESPLAYLLLLLENGDLLTRVAFRKSRAAAERVLQSQGTKAERVCAYLIGRTGSNSSLALQKELYYAQGIMLALFGVPIIPDHCEAWRHGPVFPEVWKRFSPRDVEEEALEKSGLDACVRNTFTGEELAVLDAVVTCVGCYSPYVLRDLTHSEQPWLMARDGLEEDASSNNPITCDAIMAFFIQVRDNYHMEKPSDIGRYMEESVKRDMSARAVES